MRAPRIVRNFWVETRVDGRAAKQATGPQGKDGGFDTFIYYRENGEVADEHVRVWGSVNPKTGKLTLQVEKGDRILYNQEVER